MRTQIHTNKKGFTLIEVLVAITVFILVVSAISGIFIMTLRNQRQMLAQREILDQTSYVVEYIGRFIRMAKKDINGICITATDNYATDSQDEIKFLNYRDECQRFYLSDGTIKEERDGTLLGDLTSDKLEITYLKFQLSGESQPPTDSLQPMVTVSFGVRETGATGAEFKIQTTISQRDLDVQQQ